MKKSIDYAYDHFTIRTVCLTENTVLVVASTECLPFMDEMAACNLSEMLG